ncbi:hypothetical protein KOY48_04955 [Candidatus Minimicrobia naudis]|uniref:Cell division protein FtsH n=1 Tax=Candidatus Minimicrobia naudis TaxID=2841263 RepID=A0A8F1MBR4_9BACT|nr:hypothetical protein KOY48_04955 [Candidatus Minimicrobia naudis]
MPQRNGKNRISQILRFGLFWAIIIFVALIFYATLFPASNLKDVALSDVVRRANDGKIAQLEIQGNDIKITPKDQSKPTEHSVKESSSIYEQGLNKDAKVEVKVIPPSTTGETHVDFGGYGCACADYRGVLYVYDAPSSGSK